MGAFLFLYLLENKRASDFTVGDNKIVAFRNKVIHQGYIPGYEEVLDYGDTVLSFINKVVRELEATSQEFLDRCSQQQESRIIETWKDGTMVFHSSPQILNLTSEMGLFRNKTFRAGIAQLAKNYRNKAR